MKKVLVQIFLLLFAGSAFAAIDTAATTQQCPYPLDVKQKWYLFIDGQKRLFEIMDCTKGKPVIIARDLSVEDDDNWVYINTANITMMSMYSVSEQSEKKSD